MPPPQRPWWYAFGAVASLIRRACNRMLRIILPCNAWGDFVVAWVSYILRLGRFPQRCDPKRMNDHLFRMKVDGSLLDPLRQFVTDKEYVKHYIAAIVGRQHVLETFEVLRSAAEVDQFLLDRFPCVVKPTHLSGPILFCPDSHKPLDRGLLKGWLKLNRYKMVREANYQYLEPKIIIEEFFSEDGQTPPEDYKVFCFNGVPKLIQVDAGRFVQHTRNLYDTSWNRLPVSLLYPLRVEDDPKPTQLNLMLDIAARLSEPFSFIRVDMYTNGTEVRVGELTNCPGGAHDRVQPAAAEFVLGRLFERDQIFDAASFQEGDVMQR